MTDWCFILNDQNEPVPVGDLLDLAAWQVANPARVQVGHDTVNGCIISTVFLGIALDRPPRPFESMVFDPAGNSVYQTRYETYEDAQQGHLWLKWACLPEDENET